MFLFLKFSKTVVFPTVSITLVAEDGSSGPFKLARQILVGLAFRRHGGVVYLWSAALPWCSLRCSFSCICNSSGLPVNATYNDCDEKLCPCMRPQTFSWYVKEWVFSVELALRANAVRPGAHEVDYAMSFWTVTLAFGCFPVLNEAITFRIGFR